MHASPVASLCAGAVWCRQQPSWAVVMWGTVDDSVLFLHPPSMLAIALASHSPLILFGVRVRVCCAAARQASAGGGLRAWPGGYVPLPQRLRQGAADRRQPLDPGQLPEQPQHERTQGGDAAGQLAGGNRLCATRAGGCCRPRRRGAPGGSTPCGCQSWLGHTVAGWATRGRCGLSIGASGP